MEHARAAHTSTPEPDARVSRDRSRAGRSSDEPFAVAVTVRSSRERLPVTRESRWRAMWQRAGGRQLEGERGQARHHARDSGLAGHGEQGQRSQAPGRGPRTRLLCPRPRGDSSGGSEGHRDVSAAPPLGPLPRTPAPVCKGGPGTRPRCTFNHSHSDPFPGSLRATSDTGTGGAGVCSCVYRCAMHVRTCACVGTHVSMCVHTRVHSSPWRDP